MTASLTTTRLTAPKPAETDAYTDLSADIRALADRLDLVAVAFDQGLVADRPAASAARKGWLYHATDQGRTGIGVVYFCTGTAWIIPEPWTHIITDVVSPGFAPTNDDEVRFEFNGPGGRGISWPLRYFSGLSTRKWVPLGCVPLVATNGTFPSSVKAGALVHSIGIPAPGKYLIRYTANAGGATSGATNASLTAKVKNDVGTILETHATNSEPAPASGGVALVNEIPVTLTTAGSVDVYAVSSADLIVSFRDVTTVVTPLELGT
jgi:hypothetical protein